MNTTVIDHARGGRLDPSAMHNMFRLRHNVFFQRLRWAVTSRKGLERDHYDDLDPVYIVSRGQRRQVTGCVRLLPTTGQYMLRDTFPQLLAGEEAPSSPDIWDISRLAVDRPSASSRQTADTINRVTVDLVVGVLDHALENGIDRYVAVVSVALERILRRIGLPIRRFGHGKSQWVGDTLSVAIWIDVNEHNRNTIAARNSQRRAA